MFMKRIYTIGLLLCALLSSHLTAQADGTVRNAFVETFDTSDGTGGRDDKGFSGNVGLKSISYDNEDWSGNSYVYGAYQCMRIGTGSNVGTCTTPNIILVGTGKTATLTFNAAGWGSGSNTLTITANEGVTLSGDTNITLNNSSWTGYSVNITMTTATSIQLTFTGQRGFLDDVTVTENVTAINAPTLPDEFMFWPNTTEEYATKTIMLTPSPGTTAYYTTDDSSPSKSNGSIATMATPITISGTTTVKAIAYYEDIASNVNGKTYIQGCTYDDLFDFRSVGNDDEVRLFFDDDPNIETRVLYYDESRHQLFLRQSYKGSICVDFGTTATFNPTPQYNQHVAGWVVGRKVDDNGLLKLVATENTTTDYLAFADPVTEPMTMPYDIYIEDMENNTGNWVVFAEKRVGTDLDVIDRFGTGAYNGALANISGIVIPDGDTRKIAPINYEDMPGIVYVIDEQKEFVSPDTDLADVTVCLKRTLSSSTWNTFAVPFDIVGMEGSIREYDHADGSVMVFKDASTIEAGKPYLVKPVSDIENPTYSNVTLSATPASEIKDGGYSFVAIYEPTDLATDRTEQFLKTDGKLYYPTASGTRLRGMRAFFRTPSGEGARLLIDGVGEATGIHSMDNGQWTMKNGQWRMENGEWYTLDGQKLQGMPVQKGVYIVNGKKIVIR